MIVVSLSGVGLKTVTFCGLVGDANVSAWMGGVGGSLIFIRGVGRIADLISFTAEGFGGK